ncbi:MAG: DmsC/YnfH family molybdoenzyme membrane anchor subunit, partial [Acidimicrobiales bacterium]
IVAHHADECVGCQYCMWNCPYEVPVFNKARKIVSKCDMCRPRLEQGESPACVLACPTSAIGVEKVDVAAWRDDHSAADGPGLPPADITLSTTRLILPDNLPADVVAVNAHRVQPEDPHWPLIVLTLLTQLSMGAVASTVLLQIGGAGRGGLAGAALGAFVAGAVALTASLLHLGQPGRALKALRNLRTSWLSREVALFSAFSLLSFGYAASWLGGADGRNLRGGALGLTAAALGAAGVYASARLYLVPARPVWNSRRTVVAFFATAASTGPLLALLSLDRSRLQPGWIVALLAVSGTGALMQLAVQAHLLAAVRRRTDPQHQGTAELLLGTFGTLFSARLLAPLIGIVLLVSAATAPVAGNASGGRLVVALAVLALGELAGRYLFYVTVVPYRVAGSFFGRR